MMYTDTTGATKALHLFPNIILYILYNAEAVGGFVLRCIDAVGWAMQSLKIVPDMTCHVSDGTLNFTHFLTRSTPGINRLGGRVSVSRYCTSLLHYSVQNSSYI